MEFEKGLPVQSLSGAPSPSLAQIPSLDEIGTRFGTDKAKAGHGYLDFYERFLAPLRWEPIRLLEIGVLGGASLRTWREYFSNGIIVGADVDAATKEHSSKGITIEIADQSNVADLVRLGVKHGPFDLVIDDGSHVWDHQITTLQYIYPFVKPGGFYILEDIQTSFGQDMDHYRGKSVVSAAEYLSRLSNQMVADPAPSGTDEGDAFIQTYARLTEFIAFHRHTAILHRKTQRGPVPENLPSLLRDEDGWRTAHGWLLAHFGTIGDVLFEGPMNAGTGLGGSDYALQGFALAFDTRVAGEIQYKAMSDGGVWSEWVDAGKFAGTRSQSRSLHGFAVRAAGNMELRYAGSFGNNGEIVDCRNGEECLSSDGRPLLAMQLLVRERTA